MLETAIGLITGEIGRWLAGAVGLLSVLFLARQSGKTAVENKANKARLEAIQKAKSIANDTAAKSNAEIDREAQKWTK